MCKIRWGIKIVKTFSNLKLIHHPFQLTILHMGKCRDRGNGNNNAPKSRKNRDQKHH